MLLERIRSWWVELCQQRVVPLFSRCNPWQRIPKLLPPNDEARETPRKRAPMAASSLPLRPHMLQSKADRRYSLPFAGRCITRSESMGTLIHRAFSRTWLSRFSRLCLGAGQVPLEEQRDVPASPSFVLHLEPPSLTGLAEGRVVEHLEDFSRRFNAWLFKLRRLLASLERMGSILDMPTADRIDIRNIRPSKLVEIIDDLAITGISMSLVETTALATVDTRESFPLPTSSSPSSSSPSLSSSSLSSYSSLSLVFPLLRDAELEAFSDFSSLDLRFEQQQQHGISGTF